MQFDQSSPVQPVSEYRGGSLSLTKEEESEGGRTKEILGSNIGYWRWHENRNLCNFSCLLCSRHEGDKQCFMSFFSSMTISLLEKHPPILLSLYKFGHASFKNPAYGTPLNVWTCADNSTDTKCNSHWSPGKDKKRNIGKENEGKVKRVKREKWKKLTLSKRTMEEKNVTKKLEKTYREKGDEEKRK